MWGSQFDVLFSSHHAVNWTVFLTMCVMRVQRCVHLSLFAAGCQKMSWGNHKQQRNFHVIYVTTERTIHLCTTVKSGLLQIIHMNKISAVKHPDGHTSVLFLSDTLMAVVMNGAVLSKPLRWPLALHWVGDRVWSFTQRGETFPSPPLVAESRRLLTLIPYHIQYQNSH